MTETVGFQSASEIEEVVRKFETCEYQPHEFHHARHLAVAAWYLTRFSPEEALNRMRSSLLRFTHHHSVKGYHETITRFWMTLVEMALRSAPNGSSLAGKVNAMVQSYPDKNVLFDYYSRSLVMSDEARYRWIEPDLRDFDRHSGATASTPSNP